MLSTVLFILVLKLRTVYCQSRGNWCDTPEVTHKDIKLNGIYFHIFCGSEYYVSIPFKMHCNIIDAAKTLVF